MWLALCFCWIVLLQGEGRPWSQAAPSVQLRKQDLPALSTFCNWGRVGCDCWHPWGVMGAWVGVMEVLRRTNT